jgi:CHAD domain-containing protein
MKYHEDAAIAGGIESLHQMRVATRRLRATVGLFAGVIHASRARTYNRDLPWLGQAAGEVRECDMIEALVRECSSEIDPAFAAALAPLTEVIAASRNAEHARFVNDLRTKRYRHMCEKLADPLLRNALPEIDVGCNAPAMIDPIARSVRKAGKRISRDAPPAAFHRLRVKIKRLRYALEMLIDMGGKRSRKALIHLEEMQELLGLQQDAVSTMAWLRNYAGTANGVAPETLMAVGATVQVLSERRQRLARRACRQWRRIKHSGVIKDALEEIFRAAEHRLDAARELQAAADDEAKAHRLAEAVAAYSVESAQVTPTPVAFEDSSSNSPVEPSANLDGAPDLSTSEIVATDPLALKAESGYPMAPETTALTTPEWVPEPAASSEQAQNEAEAAENAAPFAAAAPTSDDLAPAAGAPPLAESVAPEAPPAAEVAAENSAGAGESAPEATLPNQTPADSAPPDSSTPATAASAPGAATVAASDQSKAESLAENSSAPAADGATTPEPTDETLPTPHHNESR